MSEDEAVRPLGRRATSTDVARESRVSRATVSYVLNNAPGRSISDETRELVLATARRLGHVPHAPARSLRLGRSYVVLALVRDFSIGFNANRLLCRLDLALADRGYAVLVHRYDQQVRSLRDLWGLVSPAVVVAMGGLTVPEQSMILDSRAKLFRVHGLVPNEKIGEMQAEYLYSRGHRILGYAFPAAQSLELIAGERLAGVQTTCEKLGIPQPLVKTIDTDNSGSVFDALDAWKESPAPPTAICAHNDEIAMLVTLGLAARGQTPGKDLAVIGVDNTPTARISLTTIAIDVDAWGDAVAESVIDLLDDKPTPVIDRDFLQLIVRETA